MLKSLSLALLSAVAVASAQTGAASGTGRTLSQNVLARLSVEDTPGHELVQRQGLHEFTTPDPIEGVSFQGAQMKTHEQADMVDGSGTVRGYGVLQAEGDEKLFAVYGYTVPPFSGTDTVPFEGSFEWIGGTGPLADVQGAGRIEGEITRDGRATYRWNTTYRTAKQ